MSYFEMIKYKRPAGHRVTQKFANRFLRPVMGKPDQFGNFIYMIPEEDGRQSDIAFMAHYDTVHWQGGKQNVYQYRGMMYSDDTCLGADCTTGCWLILQMIKANVPGVYVIHADEEVGCVGSRKLVESQPDWLENVNFAISFDRYGYDSIITHQMGVRTASDDFAVSLESILGMGFEADTGGSYTDSNEYSSVVPECTNISVGYDHQHTRNEVQGLHHMKRLQDKLVEADWSKLEYFRDPTEYENWWMQDYYGPNRVYGSGATSNLTPTNNNKNSYDHSAWQTRSTMNRMVRENPLSTAAAMEDMGVTVQDIVNYYVQDARENLVTDVLTSYGITFDELLQHMPLSIQQQYIF